MSVSENKILISILTGCLLLVQSTHVQAQEPPLKPTELLDRSEVILVWDEGTTNGAWIQEQNLKLKFNYQGQEPGDRLFGGERLTSDTVLSFDKRQIDLVSGDFNMDKTADYLYSITGDGDSLHLVLARRTRTLNYDHHNHYRFNGRILLGKNLIAGDLNGDGISEFAVAYRPFGENVANIALFRLDDKFRLELIDTLQEEVSVNNFVIDLSDLDGDGNDELVYGATPVGETSRYFLKVYDFESDFSPVEKTGLELDLEVLSNYSTVALSGMDLDEDNKDKIVIAFTRNEHDQPNNPDTYLYTAELGDDPGTGPEDPLEKITFYSDLPATGRYNYGGGWQILLKSGDLNGDGLVEVLLGCYSGVQIFNADENMQLQHLGKQSGISGFDSDLSSINYFDVADVSGDDRDDIVTANHFFSNEPIGTQSFSILIVQYDSVFNSTVTASANQYAEIDNGGGGGMNRSHFAISLSDFDGDMFRIGEYSSMGCFTNVVRPVTVLNTPPVHIDYLDGVVHDVNECFGSNDCASSVHKYTEQFSEDHFSLETSSTGDWGYNTQFTLGYDQELGDVAGGVYMSPVEISSYFGDDLEEVIVDKTSTNIGKTTSTSRFQTSSMDKRSSRDDAILTIVSDYERWVYPVFNEYDELLGEIVILIPQTTRQENWIRGRQTLEVSGMPQLHESGNLLSYRKIYTDPKELMEVNPDIKEIIHIGEAKKLDLGSSFNETLSWGSEFENSTVSVENTVETLPSYGINFGGFQPRVSDGSPAEEEVITSHVYKVGENLGLEVYGSTLAANSYEYRIKPYFYWSVNGALVVDYMIDLSSGSFWEDNYTIQDPGFLLPNRLDSLKVKNDIDRIQDLDEYLMSSSIMLDPAIPTKGDTVKVTAIIHNLSLSPTSTPVDLSFYLGDPQKGGSLISDIEGKSLFSTADIIEDQNFTMIDFWWVADFEQNDRMYGLIDPMDNLEENKEYNNKAWTPVQRYFSCGTAPTDVLQPLNATHFEDRFSIYPNPATDQLTVEYSGPAADDVVLMITGMDGKVHEIRMLPLEGGLNQSTLNVSSLPNGVYILSFSSHNYQQHNRLLID